MGTSNQPASHTTEAANPLLLTSSNSRSNWWCKPCVLPLVLLVWFGLNGLTIERYPTVWIDEVSYADPAINLVESGHWVSSCWRAQGATEFWAGNTPLYSGLLAGWLYVTGTSIAAVRSFNLGLTVLLILVLYPATRRITATMRPVRRGDASSGGSSGAMMLSLLALTGYSVIFDYRGGRPDILCILLFALAFLAIVCTTGSARRLLVSLCAFALPWAGLQCLPVLAVIGVFLLLLNWRAYLGDFVCAALGSSLGLGALLLFYSAHSVLPAFFASVAPHTSAGTLHSLVGGQFSHQNRIPKDFSFAVLFAGVALVEVLSWKRDGLRLRSPIVLGVLLSLAITLVLILSGKFPTYYGWATYLPLSVAVVLEWSNPATAPLKRILLGAVCGLTLLVGPFMHACAAFYDWPYRKPSIPEQLVARNLNQGDLAYGDPEVYYALRHRGLPPYVGFYVLAFKPEERQRISILFIKPEHLEFTAAQLGGAWEKADEYRPPRMGFLGTHWNMGFLSVYNYHLAVYRRVIPPKTR